MKYGFRPRDCPRAEPEGNAEGENHISWYVLSRVNVLLQHTLEQDTTLLLKVHLSKLLKYLEAVQF